MSHNRPMSFFSSSVDFNSNPFCEVSNLLFFEGTSSERGRVEDVRVTALLFFETTIATTGPDNDTLKVS